MLLNDSASLHFIKHQALQPDRSQNKDWHLHLRPVWETSFRRFFSKISTGEHSCSFIILPRQEFQQKHKFFDQHSNNPRRAARAAYCPIKKLVAPTSVGATSLNAVAQGFEPWVAVTPHSISSAAPSAARTRYLGCSIYRRLQPIRKPYLPSRSHIESARPNQARRQ